MIKDRHTLSDGLFMGIADRLFAFLFILVHRRNDLASQLPFLFSRFIKLELSILVSCEMFFYSNRIMFIFSYTRLSIQHFMEKSTTNPCK